MTGSCVFQIICLDAPEQLRRRIAFPEDANLVRVCMYTLAAFGAEGNHLFEVRRGGERYVLFEDESFFGIQIGRSMPGTVEEVSTLEDTALCDLDLRVGDDFRMEYDFGAGHVFVFVLEAREEDGGQIRLLDGTGRGILEDVGPAELEKRLENGLDLTLAPGELSGEDVEEKYRQMLSDFYDEEEE